MKGALDTRNILVLLGLVIFCLSRQALSQPAGVEFPDGKTEIKVPLRRSGDKLFIPVRINGVDQGLFLLDTGASTMLLRSEVARELNLPLVVPSATSPSGAEFAMVAVPEVEIGGLKFREGFAAATDLSQHRERTRSRALNGLFGNLFFLQRTPFTISWSRAEITFYKEKPPVIPNAVQVALRVINARPAIEMRINHEYSGWFLIDTGGESGVLLEVEFANLNRRWLSPLPWRSEQLFGIGGARRVRKVQSVEGSIAGISIADCELGYLLQPWGQLRPPVQGSINASILRRFELTLDYRSETAWIRADANRGIPAEWNDPDFKPVGADLKGETPLMRAGQLREASFLQRFIAAKVPLNEQDADGETALHYAIRSGDSAIAHALIAAGAPIDISTRLEQTPLHIATLLGNADVVKVLLANGAKPDQEDSFGRTALIAASEGGNAEIVRMLITSSNLNHISLSTGSALNAAAARGKTEVVRLLLQAGADKNQTDRRKTPLLFAAIEGGSVELVALLLADGANPNALGVDGQTPLILAAANGRTQMTKLLLEKGADPRLRDREGRSAMDHAFAAIDSDTMRLLQYYKP